MVRRRRRAITAAAAPNATTRTIAVTAGQGEPVDVSAAVGAARTSLTGGSEADEELVGSDAVVDVVPLVEVAA